MLVVYNYFTNSILVEPMKDASKQSIVNAFQTKFNYLKKRGFNPKMNVMDNIASKAVIEYLEDEKIKFQLMEPYNHRINAAERAIQTWKRHIIAGKCTCHRKFPIALWCKLIKQGEMTLNMLCISRIHSKPSTYNILEGPYNFN